MEFSNYPWYIEIVEETMAKLRIKNFGPVKQGLLDNDGFIEITPLTVFCGNQATGKSTVAKLYSTFLWLEKECSRYKPEVIDEHLPDFITLCKNQRIEEYLTEKTELVYIGSIFSFYYIDGKLRCNAELYNSFLLEYKRPKIMYVPSERNLLATIEDAENIKNLPLMLSVFLDEYNKAKKNSKTGLFKIPVSDITVKYNKENLSTRVITKDNESVSIYNSSSGVQSVVPLSIVTRFLAENSVFDLEKDIQSLSNNEKKQLKPVLQNPLFFQFGGYEQAEEIMDAVLYGRKYDKEQYEKISIALKPFFNSCFVNIVEEPEQNLYPDSQSKVLYELIECMNVTENNSLFFTTHSPYMLSFLTLAAKADNLLKRGVPEEKIEPIVPVKAAVSGKNISVYETFEDGSIRKLEPYDELPSDDNLLNKAMAQSNELFAQLIDLEQEFCG